MMLTETRFEDWLCGVASEVTDETARVWNNIGITSCSIGYISDGNGCFFGTSCHRLCVASVPPAHCSFILICQTSIRHNHIGVTSSSISEVVSILGVESTGHWSFNAWVRVLGARRLWMVSSISSVTRESHFIRLFYFNNFNWIKINSIWSQSGWPQCRQLN